MFDLRRRCRRLRGIRSLQPMGKALVVDDRRDEREGPELGAALKEGCTGGDGPCGDTC